MPGSGVRWIRCDYPSGYSISSMKSQPEGELNTPALCFYSALPPFFQTLLPSLCSLFLFLSLCNYVPLFTQNARCQLAQNTENPQNKPLNKRNTPTMTSITGKSRHPDMLLYYLNGTGTEKYLNKLSLPGLQNGRGLILIPVDVMDLIVILKVFI